MRIRTLKPEILTDEKAAGLSDTEWRLFVSMIVMADDYGNFRATPAFLHTQAFWSASTSREDVAKAREGLARVSLVTIYEVNGQTYGHINGWSKHQRVDHPGKPLCPGPDQGVSVACDESSRESLETLGNIRETLAPDQDLGPGPGKGQGRERSPRAKRSALSPSFAKFWEAYPRKVAKGDAKKAWPGDELLPAILASLEWQKKQKDWQDRSFIPYPATWLRAERWTDEPDRQPSLLSRPKPSPLPKYEPRGDYAAEAAADPDRARKDAADDAEARRKLEELKRTLAEGMTT